MRPEANQVLHQIIARDPKPRPQQGYYAALQEELEKEGGMIAFL
jgi:hypothetical protein